MKKNGTVVISTDASPGGSDNKYGQQTPVLTEVFSGGALEVPLSYMTNQKLSGDADVKRHSRLYEMAVDVETIPQKANVTFTRNTGVVLKGHVFDIDTNAQIVTVRWQ